MRDTPRLLALAMAALTLAFAAIAPSAGAATRAQPTTLGPGGGPMATAMNSRGDAVAVWTESHKVGDRLIGTVKAAFRPAGGSWSPAQTISTGEADTALSPNVVFDGGGNAVAAWVFGNGRGLRVQSSRLPSGGGWTTPQSVSDVGAADPQLAIDSTGRAVLGWNQIEFPGSQDVLVSLAPPGGNFGPPAVLSGEGIAELGNVVISGAGRVALVWHDQLNGTVYAATKTTSQANFVITKLAGGGAAQPAIGFDAGGNAIAVWVQPVGGGQDVIMSAVTAATGGGGFSTPAAVSVPAVGLSAPEITVDSNGVQVVVFNAPTILPPLVKPPSAPTPPSGTPSVPTVPVAVPTPKPPALPTVLPNVGSGGGGGGTPTVVPTIVPTVVPTAVPTIPSGGGGLPIRAEDDDTVPLTQVYAATRPPGGDWSAPTPVSPSNAPASGALLQSLSAGKVVAVWRQESGPAGLVASVRSVKGTWNRPFVVSAPSESVLGAHALATNRRGNAIVAWTTRPADGKARAVTLKLAKAPATRAKVTGAGTRLRHLATADAAGTHITRIRLTGVPRGSRVQVLCAGGGCPFARRSVAGRGTVYLARLFAGRTLKPGAKVEVLVRAGGRTVRGYRLTARAGRGPRLNVL